MKKNIQTLLLVICLLILMPLSLNAVELPLIYDEADLLTDTEEAELLAKLDSLSDRTGMDVVIAAVDSTADLTPMEYADNFFDYNGFGRGANRDGLILLISMSEHDWWISTSGYAITVFTDAGIDYIGDKITSYLSYEDYAAAFDEFVLQCDAFIAQANTGDPYDSHNLPKEPFDKGVAIIVALIVGFIIAKIYTGKLKGQLNTVQKQTEAKNYVKKGSMNIANANEFFLYRDVNRREKESSSKKGGSSTHTSSSGASHGGGGGKF